MKFIESYPGNGRKILTPNGYREILEVHKTIPYIRYKLILRNGMTLECAGNHVVINSNNVEVRAKDSLGELIQTTQGNSRVTDVINTNIEENMYDISIDSGDELYYSNGILSHNSGKSVTVGIYLTHLYNFSQDRNVGIVANRGAMAREFLNNVKNMYLELPIWMQLGTKVWNKGSIENESGMRILTDVPSSDSFRGYSIHCLVIDECIAYKETITIRDDYTGEIRTLKIGDFYKEFE